MTDLRANRVPAGAIEVALPARVLAIPGISARTRAFLWRRLRVLVSIESGRWHVSMTGIGRAPTWEEIREVRYAFAPDEITMGILFPPQAEYVNLNPLCFHLWQVEGDHA